MKKLNKWLDAWNQELVDEYNKTWEKPTGDKKKDLRAKQRLNLQARFDYIELEKYLDAIRVAVAEGDIENAVLLTATFQRKADECEVKISIPDMEKQALSSSGSHAVNVRHAKRWTEVKKESLKRDFLKRRPELSSNYAACRELAGLILKDKDKWQQIQRQLRKMNVID